MTQKILVLDMDGTIDNLYAVPDWHKCLYETLDATPYKIARPIYDMGLFNAILSALHAQGWTIVIDTWLSRTKDDAFHAAIREAKLQWLENYKVPYDDLIMTDYGISKWETIQAKYPDAIKVLVDDSAEVRADWKGYSIDGNANIILQLAGLLMQPEYAD